MLVGFQLACCTAARLVKTVVRPNQLFFSRLTGLIRRIELVRVAQLALVLEVVDSARARQVGGHVDALATPEAVGRGQSMVSNAALARQTRRQRAGSGRQRAGRAGAPVMAAGPFLQLRSVM